ncbi:MAG: hypothetical protein IPJ74_07735 [Saprospiraceae bacterium]|nr:hypothetical protein [Saprospiraceae bacterium]
MFSASQRVKDSSRSQRLAEQGYITITADAAYQGGSGGTPRSVDKPANPWLSCSIQRAAQLGLPA